MSTIPRTCSCCPDFDFGHAIVLQTLRMAADARMEQAVRCKACAEQDALCAECEGLILDSLEFDYLARDLLAGRLALTHPAGPSTQSPNGWTLTDAVTRYRDKLATRMEQL